MNAVDSKNISPTAFATGYFWYAHGMSHAAFVTPKGRRLHYMFRPLIHVARIAGGYSIDALMLARHRGINGVLTQLIESGKVQQIVEVAAGLSPRGWDLMRTYSDRLTYIETDLADMAALKRQLLSQAGMLSDRHQVVELDALADSGDKSIFAVLDKLDRSKGTAIITEGLMGYFDTDTALSTWKRFSKALKPFKHGYYVSDAYMVEDHNNAGAGIFRTVLGSFVKGRIHVHFESGMHAVEVMARCGFASGQCYKTDSIKLTQDIAHIAGADRVQILEASVNAN